MMRRIAEEMYEGEEKSRMRKMKEEVVTMALIFFLGRLDRLAHRIRRRRKNGENGRSQPSCRGHLGHGWCIAIIAP
jgi:hypothetical protein